MVVLEARWLRNMIPGLVYLGSDFTLGLTVYVTLLKFLILLSLNFPICTSVRLLSEFSELIFVELFVAA